MRAGAFFKSTLQTRSKRKLLSPLSFHKPAPILTSFKRDFSHTGLKGRFHEKDLLKYIEKPKEENYDDIEEVYVASDIYAGPLSRYYSNAWIPPPLEFNLAEFEEYYKVEEEEATDMKEIEEGHKAFMADKKQQEIVKEVRTRTLMWKDLVKSKLKKQSFWNDAQQGVEFDQWKENMEENYITYYHPYLYHLFLWAAHADQPHIKLDKTKKIDLNNWRREPAYEQASSLIIEGQYERPFSHILNFVECWLPVTFPLCFEAYDVANRNLVFGSSPVLLAQLNHLNELTWQASSVEIQGWKLMMEKVIFQREGLNFENGAKLGFSIMHEFASYSTSHHTPICLYY